MIKYAKIFDIYYKKLNEFDPNNMTLLELEQFIKVSLKINLLRKMCNLMKLLNVSLDSMTSLFGNEINGIKTLDQFNSMLSSIISNIKQIYSMVDKSDIIIKNIHDNTQDDFGVDVDKIKSLMDNLIEQVNVYEQ